MKSKIQSYCILAFIIFLGLSEYAFSDETVNWIYQTWHSNSWVNASKRATTKDDNGYIKEIISWTWSLEEWVLESKRIYTKSANQDVIIYQTWDVNNSAWVNATRLTTKYDNNGNILEEIYDKTENDNWSEYYWSKYEYEDELVKYEYSYFKTAGVWELLTKTENFYEDGLLVSYIEYSAFDDELTQDTKTDLEYDNSNNVIKETKYFWDVEGSEIWIEYSQTLFTYNSFGDSETMLYKLWNGSDWENNSKEIWHYTEDGKMIDFITSNWNGSEWVDEYMYSYTYDDNEIIQTLTEVWNGFNWVYESKGFKEGSGDVIDGTIISCMQYSIFPNPTNNSVQLNVNLNRIGDLNVEVFNLNGRLIDDLGLIQDAYGSIEYRVDLTNYPSGSYYIVLSLDNQKITEKIIVK